MAVFPQIGSFTTRPRRSAFVFSAAKSHELSIGDLPLNCPAQAWIGVISYWAIFPGFKEAARIPLVRTE